MGYQAEALKHFRNELSGPQCRVLRSLASAEEWRPAQRYNTNTLYGLHRRGLIERRYADQLIRITPKGREAIQ